MMKSKKMKLRKRLQSRNRRKNFYRKILRIHDMCEKISICNTHRIMIIIARKTVFQIPNFVIRQQIILKKSATSNNYFTFFIININKCLRTPCFRGFCRIKSNFFSPNTFIFYKKFLKSI